MNENSTTILEYIRENKKLIKITLTVIVIFNLFQIIWPSDNDSLLNEQFPFIFYVCRFLAELVTFITIILVSFLAKQKYIDAIDLVPFFVNAFVQFFFNAYLLITLNSKVIHGYDMGIVSIPFYSIIGAVIASMAYLFVFLLFSLTKRKKIIKILVSLIVSFMVTYIYEVYYLQG